MSLLRRFVSRAFPVLSLAALPTLLFSGCQEEVVGPQLEPEPASNACLDLQSGESSEQTQTDPEALLPVFDCLNSQGSFDALRAPLAYTIDQGYLDPYFLLPGYLDPLNLEENVQSGDLSLTITSLQQLLTDPDDPLGALLDVYVELYESESALSTAEKPVSHLDALLHLSRLYTSAIYPLWCDYRSVPAGSDDCWLLEMINDLYYSEAVQVLQENAAQNAESVDPKLAQDLVYDVTELARNTTSQATGTDNLLLGVTAAMLVDPAPSDPYKTVDDAYVAGGKTFLESLQQPLCQLRSDPDLVGSGSSGESSTYALSLLPTWLSTLNAYDPNGRSKTETPTEVANADSDGDTFTPAQGDCNDADATIYPHADEIYDRKDNDCDLVADGVDTSGETPKSEMDQTDADGDGVPPRAGDCNDADDTVHPYYKVTYPDESVVVYEAAPELSEDGAPDLKDNDCDGFVDRIGSSLEILLNAGRVMLPSTYQTLLDTNNCSDGADNDGDGLSDGVDAFCSPECNTEDWKEAECCSEFGCEGTATTLHSLLALLAANAAIAGGDTTALLYQFSETAEALVSNYANGTLSPELTAQARVALPVVYQMAELGMLSSASVDSALGLHADYIEYKQTCVDANGHIKSECTLHANSCGEQFDGQIDTLAVLSELIRMIDGYSLLDEPHLLQLIPILAESDLLYHAVDLMTSGAEGEKDPAIQDAVLELFDYFIAPPEDNPGAYVDNYEDARLWKVVPLLTLLWSDPAYVEEIDALMIYMFEGLDDPASALSGLPEALEALAKVDTGGSVNTQALLEVLINPEYDYLLRNGLLPLQDPNLINILIGDWEALPDEIEAKYKPANGESTLGFMARWIRDGKVDALLDMAGDILTWVVENTKLDELSSDAPSPTPGPTPTPTPGP